MLSKYYPNVAERNSNVIRTWSENTPSASQAQTKCDPTTVQPPLKRALNTAQAQPECAPIVTQAATKHSPKCEEGMISKQLQPLRLAKFHYRFLIPKAMPFFNIISNTAQSSVCVAVRIFRYKFQTRSDDHRAKCVYGVAREKLRMRFQNEMQALTNWFHKTRFLIFQSDK